MNKLAYFVLLQSIRDAIPQVQRTNFDIQFATSEKNIAIALLLSLIFGCFGIDRFYLGQVGLGLLKLFTFGGLGIWTIIDWFIIMRATRTKNIEIASKIRTLLPVNAVE